MSNPILFLLFPPLDSRRIATFLDKVEPVIASVENPQLKHFLQGGGVNKNQAMIGKTIELGGFTPQIIPIKNRVGTIEPSILGVKSTYFWKHPVGIDWSNDILGSNVEFVVFVSSFVVLFLVCCVVCVFCSL